MQKQQQENSQRKNKTDAASWEEGWCEKAEMKKQK